MAGTDGLFWYLTGVLLLCGGGRGAGANWNSIHDKHRLRGNVSTTYLHPQILTHLNYWDS